MDVYPDTKNGKFTVSNNKVYGTDESKDIAVGISINMGMQKGFDEYEKDIEDAFDKYGDQIEDALKNY